LAQVEIGYREICHLIMVAQRVIMRHLSNLRTLLTHGSIYELEQIKRGLFNRINVGIK